MENKIDLFCDNISVQGFSHIKGNKECQDSSLSWKTDTYCAVIVCDGHGGDRYIRSAIGSRLACEAGRELISAFMEKFKPLNKKQIESSLEQLERAIVSTWVQMVTEDFEKASIEEDERFQNLEDADKAKLIRNPIKAYGSTFIASVMTDDFFLVIKLGDGNAVIFYPDGEIEMPAELSDEECQFNVTTSLCNNDAALSFLHYFRLITPENKISGIALTSDGVINCYNSEKHYLSFMRNVFSGYGEDGIEKAREELIPALNELSEHGSGDDLSVAIIRKPLISNEIV